AAATYVTTLSSAGQYDSGGKMFATNFHTALSEVVTAMRAWVAANWLCPVLFAIAMLIQVVSANAQVTWSISPSSPSVSEGAGSLTFTVTRSNSTSSVTVYASTTTTEGYANNNDYAGIANQALTFSVGQTQRTVTISITN